MSILLLFIAAPKTFMARLSKAFILSEKSSGTQEKAAERVEECEQRAEGKPTKLINKQTALNQSRIVTLGGLS